ncbi:uncoordinated protein 112 (mitogen inducible mig-2 protein like) [Schistosoma mansoni]|nr:uncoordinated protein 112 (mitogen inducible mig-2 protein like) [Schistosoma mansoni]|eukprot:XP_018646662.1 uncoordinated protein 112 (mitogen inducible mig-2 protein like) [Schistosoma mansoni]
MNRSSTMNNNHITISISRKIESIGIGSTRIYRCDLTNGEILASWRMSSIQSWHINWELSELVLNIAIQSNTMNTTTTNTTTGRVIIRPIDVSVRMIAEFLGGYTFLNLRSPEKNQCLAEDIFYKLTTGMSQPFV